MLFTIGVNWRELTFELTRNFLGWASPASGRLPCPISPESKKHSLVSLFPFPLPPSPGELSYTWRYSPFPIHKFFIFMK